MHNPDKWVIIRLKSEKTLYKILAGWSGGYLDSDNWRMSSGLESIEEDGDYYLMHNYSGSTYKCHKKSEGFTSLSGTKYSEFKKAVKDTEWEIDLSNVDEFNKEHT